MYVGASRAKQKMTLYTDNKAAVRKAVQRSSQKLAASDLLPKRGKAKDRMQEIQRRQKRLAYLNHVRAAWDAPMPPPQIQPERQVDHGR
jgi:hypothetical protein